MITINAKFEYKIVLFFFFSTFMLIFYCDYYSVAVYSPI